MHMLYRMRQTPRNLSKEFSPHRLWQQLMSQPGTPHQLGLAFAIGTFISILPTPGFNFVLASMLLAKWHTLHRAALFASLGVWNMFVVAPLYTLSFQFGRWLFGTPMGDASPLSPLDNPLLWVQGFLVGNVVTAVTIATLCYFVIKTAVACIPRQNGRV